VGDASGVEENIGVPFKKTLKKKGVGRGREGEILRKASEGGGFREIGKTNQGDPKQKSMDTKGKISGVLDNKGSKKRKCHYHLKLGNTKGEKK